ncbi:DUF6249 domain-containing protein [Dysgonomonas reticulitermitis]|nr:hypothetical protein FACS1894169_03970 [Bacteroidia bacterium]
MNDLVPIFVMGIITLGIYKIFELFVRRNERISIIEKLSNIDPETLKHRINFPVYKDESVGSWSIRIGLLLIGVGLGVVIATIVDISTAIPSYYKGQLVYDSLRSVDVLYPSCAAVFGGIGLVIAYFIEKKKDKKD